MPLFDVQCEKCGNTKEVFGHIGSPVPECCGQPMERQIGRPAFIRIKGQGYPSRRKWMDNWTPDSPPFDSKVLVHGAKYESRGG